MLVLAPGHSDAREDERPGDSPHRPQRSRPAFAICQASISLAVHSNMLHGDWIGYASHSASPVKRETDTC